MEMKEDIFAYSYIDNNKLQMADSLLFLKWHRSRLVVANESLYIVVWSGLPGARVFY